MASAVHFNVNPRLSSSGLFSSTACLGLTSVKKVQGRGNIMKKKESEVQRKMLRDVELHIVSKRR